jgi:hypothetical protein
MKPETLWDELQSKVVGHAVTFRRLAANSLLLYVDNQPGDRTGVTFWLEPTWHVRAPGSVLVGSRQAQFEDEAQEEEGLPRIGALLDVLLGREIEAVSLEPETFDLTVKLAGGYVVKTFVSNATDEESWHIRDNATGAVLYGSPGGLSVREKTPS